MKHFVLLVVLLGAAFTAVGQTTIRIGAEPNEVLIERSG